MKRVLVTGARGLLGSTLVPTLARSGYEVISFSRGSRAPGADLTDADATLRALDKIAPEAIVNLAALTDVDACERDPNAAFMANARPVESIARWITSRGAACHLVQVSTDQVYGGAGPHDEDQVALFNYYAFSKYTGELLARAVPATILRTNLFGRSRCATRQSLSDWVVAALRNGAAARVFTDVFFTPLSLETLSEMICLTLERRSPGLFNLGCREGMSKADFAFALGAALGLSTTCLTRASSTEAQLAARRPGDMRMRVTRFESTFGVQLPTLLSEINRTRDAYAN